MKKLQAAILVEGHPYDIVGFQRMLWSFTDFECYVQPVDLFLQDDENHGRYDVVLWYNIHWDPPGSSEADLRLKRYLEFGASRMGQGIVVLHHALLNYQDWDVWTDICGLRNRGSGGLFKYTQGQTVAQHVVDPSHPIVEGIKDFSLVDETYIIGEPEEKGNHILLTTNNETSIKNIAWTRDYGNSKVFCYASGHDNKAYADENFRRVLRQGMEWVTGVFTGIGRDFSFGD